MSVAIWLKPKPGRTPASSRGRSRQVEAVPGVSAVGARWAACAPEGARRTEAGTIAAIIARKRNLEEEAGRMELLYARRVPLLGREGGFGRLRRATSSHGDGR